MATRLLISKTRTLLSPFHSPCSLIHSYLISTLTQLNPNPSLPDLVNEISRTLSDHRNPHHDLESSLNTFSSKISTNLVEQVLKRCKNLGFSAHRFFLWARRIPGFKHSKESHQILVDVLGASKQFAILWDFLTEMRGSHDFKINSEIIWLVFRSYCRANLPNDAIRTFYRMVEFDLKPSVDDLDKLLYFLCKSKHEKQAQQFFDRVKHKFEPKAKTYSILVRGWGDIGDTESARKMFDEMLCCGCALDVLGYNGLLEALCKGGNVDGAYKIFREMGSHGVEPDACSYAIFIRAFCEANDIHSAFKVLDRMKRYDLVPNLFTYNGVIKKLCKNEKVEEAYQLLNEMMERGVSPDSWSYNSILAYHCDHSEVNRATKLMSIMIKDNCLPDRHSYNMLLKLLVRVGRFDRATEIWESMENRRFYPSVSIYAVMIHGLCKKKGKLEEACKYFEMMVDEGIPPYATTVAMLRNRLIGLGLLDTIEVLARKMERSTCCSIQELANEMRSNKTCVRTSNGESEPGSE